MIKFRIESNKHSKYFREEEREEAEKYFKSRIILGIPVEF